MTQPVFPADSAPQVSVYGPDIKPGPRTTEFWITVFTSAIGAFVAIAGLFGHNLDGSKLQPLIPMAALIAVGVANAWYSHGRSQVKAAAITLAPATPVTVISAPAKPGG